MKFRSTFLILTAALTLSPALFAEQQHMQGMQQQQQMGMGMGMGMGGGMGGGAGAKYESKREEITKSLEQPAAESRKAMRELNKSFAQETKAQLQETSKAITAGMAKDEKMDEKTLTALSPAAVPEDSAATAAADELLKTIVQYSKETSALIDKQREEMAKANEAAAAAAAEAGRGNTMADRILAASGGRASSGSSALASAMTPGGAAQSKIDNQTQSPSGNHGGGTMAERIRAFQPGLLHNPPTGVQVE